MSYLSGPGCFLKPLHRGLMFSPSPTGPTVFPHPLRYPTLAQKVGLNASPLTSLQRQKKNPAVAAHASRDGVTLPPCDVCEDGPSRARLSLAAVIQAASAVSA